MRPAIESAVRDPGRESTEAERQRAGAERHEEDDGRDEGWSAASYLRVLQQFSQNENHISHKPCNNNTVI